MRRFLLLGAAVAGSVDRWVVTHGEPHTANLICTPDGPRLVDWGTVCLAPRERDLREALGEAEGDEPWFAYVAAGGRPEPLSPDTLELFALEWHLGEIAEHAVRFSRAHADTADERRCFADLETEVAACSTAGPEPPVTRRSDRAVPPPGRPAVAAGSRPVSRSSVGHGSRRSGPSGKSRSSTRRTTSGSGSHARPSGPATSCRCSSVSTVPIAAKPSRVGDAVRVPAARVRRRGVRATADSSPPQASSTCTRPALPRAGVACTVQTRVAGRSAVARERHVGDERLGRAAARPAPA